MLHEDYPSLPNDNDRQHEVWGRGLWRTVSILVTVSTLTVVGLTTSFTVASSAPNQAADSATFVRLSGENPSTNHHRLTALHLYHDRLFLRLAWSKTGNMNSARTEHTASVLSNGKILVAGGCNGTVINSVEFYDASTHSWVFTQSMKQARSYHTASTLTDGKVLVTGGTGPLSKENRAATCLLSSKALHMIDQMTQGRKNRQTGVLFGSWLLSDGDVQSSAEIYDPSVDAWLTTRSMRHARVFHTASVLPNGKVLVVGGADNVTFLQTAELYDPSNDTWTLVRSLHGTRGLHSASVLKDGRVLISGGIGSDSSEVSQLYDPYANSWKMAGLMNIPRIFHTASLLGDGTVLVTGGLIDKTGLPDAELYNPSTNTWVVTGSMNNGRAAHTATVLSNGKVLVTGGYGLNASTLLNSSELYDPTTERWTIVEPMNDERFFHQASVLSDGTILVAGGYTEQSKILKSAELNNPSARQVVQ